jgi:hypothetical protein
MESSLKSTCLAGVASLAVLILPVWAEGPNFIRLDLPSSELEKLSGICPIRVELPISKLFAGSEKTYRSGRAVRLVCDSAYISLITVENYPAAHGLKSRIHPTVTIALPQGHDKLVEVKYWFMRGNEVLSSGGEEISAGEGKINGSDGADLWYGARVGENSSNLSLRIEASVSDR